jgi:hypothetical protein
MLSGRIVQITRNSSPLIILGVQQVLCYSIQIAHRLVSACYIGSVTEDVARKGAGRMCWFKPPLVNVTSDPDRHIKLNRLAIRGTTGFRALANRVANAATPKDFRERAVELLDPPYSIGVEGRAKSTSWLFSTGLISRKPPRATSRWQPHCDARPIFHHSA